MRSLGRSPRARLRALQREQERRKGGWDRGCEERRTARARLDALDGDVLAAADAGVPRPPAPAEAEGSFRRRLVDRERGRARLPRRGRRETGARDELASQASRAARMDTCRDEIARIEAQLREVVAELEAKEAELDLAEAAYREAEDRRRQVEEIRRRVGEEAAGRRAEAEATERALASAEREHERVAHQLAGVRERIAAAEAAHGETKADIEQMDGQTAPLAERRDQLDDERRKLVDRIEELTEARRRMQARKDLLEARRRDIEETPGSRFLAGATGDAIGLLKDLVRVGAGLERALVAALGPLADAVSTTTATAPLEDAPRGRRRDPRDRGGRTGPDRAGGRAALLSRSRPSRPRAASSARSCATSTSSPVIEEAAEADRAPAASFVTPEGVLVGPAVIHTAKEADARLREIRAELQVLAHDLSATEQRAQAAHASASTRSPARSRSCRSRSRPPTPTSPPPPSGSPSSSASSRPCARKRSCSRTARVARRERAAWRERLAAMGPGATEEMPELPPLAAAPIHARVAVETLRRDRSTHDDRLVELRAERDTLAAHDPIQLRAELEAAEAARTLAERTMLSPPTTPRSRRPPARDDGGGGRARRRARPRPRSTAPGAMPRPSSTSSARVRGRGPTPRRHRAPDRRRRAPHP